MPGICPDLSLADARGVKITCSYQFDYQLFWLLQSDASKGIVCVLFLSNEALWDTSCAHCLFLCPWRHAQSLFLTHSWTPKYSSLKKKINLSYFLLLFPKPVSFSYISIPFQLCLSVEHEWGYTLPLCMRALKQSCLFSVLLAFVCRHIVWSEGCLVFSLSFSLSLLQLLFSSALSQAGVRATTNFYECSLQTQLPASLGWRGINIFTLLFPASSL